MICDRCSNQSYFLEKCEYCAKNVCVNCAKSAKRVQKIRRLLICKGCWGNLRSRSKFKGVN